MLTFQAQLQCGQYMEAGTLVAEDDQGMGTHGEARCQCGALVAAEQICEVQVRHDCAL